MTIQYKLYEELGFLKNIPGSWAIEIQAVYDLDEFSGSHDLKKKGPEVL